MIYNKEDIPDDLQQYFEPAEIGSEQEVEEYIDAMVDVFREVRRCLRDDGTVWLNLGDSYMAQKNVAPPPQTIGGQRDMPTVIPGNRREQKGLKHKDLIGIPWRVAFALQADGWWLRQDIIWHKPNPMPESVTDRCTKAHEYIFLLSKKSHYYFDNEAIKEDAKYADCGRPSAKKGSFNAKGEPLPGQVPFRAIVEKKNKRSVWSVNTKGYKGAHFAVYPKKLIEPCILAGTSAHGCCSKCGAPWKREVESVRIARNQLPPSDPRYRPNTYNGSYGTINGKGDAGYNQTKTLGWSATCNCKDAKIVPCTVLDPFTGSGTTAVVALENNRNFVGTELNPEYIKIAENRIKEEIPTTLASVMD